jgi:hypothetical protein
MPWAVKPTNSNPGRLMAGICFEVNHATIALKRLLNFYTGSCRAVKRENLGEYFSPSIQWQSLHLICKQELSRPAW